MVNNRTLKSCTTTSILERGDLGWATDHEAVSMELLDLKVLRRAERQRWQRQTYNTKNLNGAKEARIAQKAGGMDDSRIKG